MAKKPLNVTIRKASSAQPSEKPSDKDVFVSGGKAGFRSVTLYLPDALADKLAAHCRETDRDMSALVSDIVERHLAGFDQPTRVIEMDDPVTALRRWVSEKFSRVASLRPAWLF
jgi:hypothetical protein